ncbi:hypothetical protein EG68_08752 [Paragonimus skrjabini miyazakii]|uniref:CUB domain-containing protein n=1 Tax=Paragonimus skrjabini miyazakii TaxID=59628 RepID=A0A8S9YJ47_9TREM|nr:hypothetical protein EG68_08752 [Paragonimus skrjabini miyazakii]
MKHWFGVNMIIDINQECYNCVGAKDAECGGDFSAIEGEVVSPDYTNQPDDPMLRCEWTIGYKNAFGVKITVEYFQAPNKGIQQLTVDYGKGKTSLNGPGNSQFATDNMTLKLQTDVSDFTGLRFRIQYGSRFGKLLDYKSETGQTENQMDEAFESTKERNIILDTMFVGVKPPE